MSCCSCCLIDKNVPQAFAMQYAQVRQRARAREKNREKSTGARAREDRGEVNGVVCSHFNRIARIYLAWYLLRAKIHQVCSLLAISPSITFFLLLSVLCLFFVSFVDIKNKYAAAAGSQQKETHTSTKWNKWKSKQVLLNLKNALNINRMEMSCRASRNSILSSGMFDRFSIVNWIHKYFVDTRHRYWLAGWLAQ